MHDLLFSQDVFERRSCRQTYFVFPAAAAHPTLGMSVVSSSSLPAEDEEENVLLAVNACH